MVFFGDRGPLYFRTAPLFLEAANPPVPATDKSDTATCRFNISTPVLLPDLAFTLAMHEQCERFHPPINYTPHTKTNEENRSMRSRIHFLMMAMVAVVMVTLATVCGTDTARGQAVCNSPNLTIINNSTCAVAPCLTRPGLTALCFPPVPGGITSSFGVPPGTIFSGVQTAGGTGIAWVPSLAPPPPLVVACFRAAPSNCCVDIFYDPATCTIWIFNSGCNPAVCRP